MRPVVLFVAFRPFDLRLIVDSGVIQKLADHLPVALLGPPAMKDTLTAMLAGRARFESLCYRTNKVQGMGDLAEARPGFRGLLRSQIEQCLRLVYGQPSGVPENRTGKLHRQTFRQDLSSRHGAGRAAGFVVLAIAWLANRARLFRTLLQRTYARLSDFEDHQQILKELAPALVVLPSAGLSIDGWFMLEARRAGIPVVVLSQSWDRTSSKGYPTSPPDYVVVWSEAMREEVVNYWDVPDDRVFVEGAPPWDGHFLYSVTVKREDFLRTRGLDPASKTVYVALTGPAWHENNKALVEDLLWLRRENPELKDINLLVRVHPNYLSSAFSQRLDDLLMHLKKFEGLPNFVFDIPDVRSIGSTFVVGNRYDAELREILTHADVMVSVPSSQLIEAAIFDLPYVELNYGRWKNEVLDVDLSDFQLQHFIRLRRHGAGPLCSDPAELGRLLADELAHPECRKSARTKLAEQEAGTNKGHAAAATAARLRELAEAIVAARGADH